MIRLLRSFNMDADDPFIHLESRCKELITKYAMPIILAEEVALKSGMPLPDTDFDQLVALRLIAHAEFEGYFEAKARRHLDELRQQFDAGSALTASHASLIFLHLQKSQIAPVWSSTSLMDDRARKAAESADFKNMLNSAFGFANDFIVSNNGIKENSIFMLAAISGIFPDQLDTTLVAELNQFGIDRGAVAHVSWKFSKKANVQSAIIEKNRIERLLKLIKEIYYPTLYSVPPTRKGGFQSTRRKIQSIWHSIF